VVELNFFFFFFFNRMTEVVNPETAEAADPVVAHAVIAGVEDEGPQVEPALTEEIDNGQPVAGGPQVTTPQVEVAAPVTPEVEQDWGNFQFVTPTKRPVGSAPQWSNGSPEIGVCCCLSSLGKTGLLTIFLAYYLFFC